MDIKNLLSKAQFKPIEYNRLISENTLPAKVESTVLGMLNFNKNLILTGSCSLYIIGLLEAREPHDIDFGLESNIQLKELEELKNFFQLVENSKDDHSQSLDLNELQKEEYINENIQFIKALNGKTYNSANDLMFSFEPVDFIKIDIFRREYLKPQDITEVVYRSNNLNQTIILPIAHPSIPISYKLRYAFDPRVRAKDKHMEDLNNISKEYHKIVHKNLKFRD